MEKDPGQPLGLDRIEEPAQRGDKEKVQLEGDKVRLIVKNILYNIEFESYKILF